MLFDQLTQDYLQAMKNKQQLQKSALNFLLAQIKNKQIELQRVPNDDEIITIIKKEIKSIQETIGFLEQSNKAEDLAAEQEKKQILQSYLPAMLDKAQTQALIEHTILQLQITDLKTQRGLLMKALMAKYKTELDGSLVNEIINTLL